MRPSALMTTPSTQRALVGESDEGVKASIMELARDASIEVNVQELKDIEASCSFLGHGRKVYISFPPKQTWADTEAVCRAVSQAGLDPVPHIPVRLLVDAQDLERVIGRLVAQGRAEEVLLLSGDYPNALGPYSRVEDVLSTGVLVKYGLRRVSFAAHPEGHPKVPLGEIRRAERAKVLGATASGLSVSLVTQFLFEPEPFFAWAKQLNDVHVHARLIAGLAGPARLSTLFKFALRCGVGSSLRALGAHPTALTKLL